MNLPREFQNFSRALAKGLLAKFQHYFAWFKGRWCSILSLNLTPISFIHFQSPTTYLDLTFLFFLFSNCCFSLSLSLSGYFLSKLHSIFSREQVKTMSIYHQLCTAPKEESYPLRKHFAIPSWASSSLSCPFLFPSVCNKLMIMLKMATRQRPLSCINRAVEFDDQVGAVLQLQQCRLQFHVRWSMHPVKKRRKGNENNA